MRSEPMSVIYARGILQAGIANNQKDGTALRDLLSQCKKDPDFVGEFRHLFGFTPKQLFKEIRLAIRRADYRVKRRKLYAH